MEEKPIYLDLSPAVRKRLATVDLGEELRKRGIEARIEYGKIPGAQKKGATRDVSLIILAAAASAPLVGTAIAKIIDAWWRRPHTVTTVTVKPVFDPSGKVLKDKRGNIVKERTESVQVREMKGKSQENSSSEFKLGAILSFKTTSGEAASPPKDKPAPAKSKRKTKPAKK